MALFRRNKKNNKTETIEVKINNKNKGIEFINKDFKSWFFGDKSMYEIDTVRSTVNRIATDVAQVEVTSQITTDDDVVNTNKYNLKFLLNVRPNYYLSAYDMFYSVITKMYLESNAFIYIERDRFNNNIVAFHPIYNNSAEIYQISNGDVFVKFVMSNGSVWLADYADLIHLRRFNYKSYIGETPNSALDYSTRILQENYNTIINNLKQSGNLRGILKINTALNKEDRQTILQDFINENLQNKNLGIIVADQSWEFVSVNSDFKLYNDKQMNFFRSNIYNFFNIAEEIVKGNYTPAQYQAYLSSILQPIVVQMEQEFTFKIFTKRELEVGNRLSFDTKKLLMGNLPDTTDYIGKLSEHGIISANEGRQMIGLPKVPGLDMYRFTKNSSTLAEEEQSTTNLNVNAGGREPPATTESEVEDEHE